MQNMDNGSQMPNNAENHAIQIHRSQHEKTAEARYDVSVSAALVPPINPEIDVILVGDAREIKCRAGGCTRKERWEIGKAAFMQLMQRYGKVQ